MSEARLQLNYRVPDQQRLEWAQRIVKSLGKRLPETTTEVYAREQLFLARTEVDGNCGPGGANWGHGYCHNPV